MKPILSTFLHRTSVVKLVLRIDFRDEHILSTIDRIMSSSVMPRKIPSALSFDVPAILIWSS